MEAMRVKETNKRKIYQIIENEGKSLLERRVELRKKVNKAGYILDYCIDKNLSIEFDCGLVLNIETIKGRGTKNEYIDIALKDFTFERDYSTKTYLDQLNICLREGYILQTDQNMFKYRLEDLNRMINLKISCVSLFGSKEYILNCPPTVYNLRKYCILENLVPISDFYKRLRPPTYYERLLGFRTSIERGKKTYVFLCAMGKGFSENIDEEDSMDYFDFLDIEVKYPKTLKRLFEMNKIFNKEGLNLIEVYNKNIRVF